MSLCVVPGCINLLQEWMTFFPQNTRLANRWATAIEVGTGRQIPKFNYQDAQICNMHFALSTVQNYKTDEAGYREPTLFFRENVLIQIANCGLCHRFEIVDDMYKLSECIVSDDNDTLYTLARKYFNFPRKPHNGAQYLCENCVVQIDMTHSFWRKISSTWNANKKVFKMMRRQKIVFRNNDTFLNDSNGGIIQVQPASTISVDSAEDTEDADAGKIISLDSDTSSDAMEQFEDVIVKEETQLEIRDSTEEMPVVSSIDGNQSWKCYSCNHTFQNQVTLTEHISNSHVERSRRACKNCNRTFISALLYNEHMASHKPYCCNYCPLEFNERREVVIHEVQEHSGEKLNEYCSNCGKLFRSKIMLEQHMTSDCRSE